MILKIVISFLLALSAANALAGSMYIYKDQGGQVLLAHVDSTGNSNKLNKKVGVNHYSNSNTYLTPKKVYRNKSMEMALEEVSPSTDVKKVYRSKSMEMALE